MVDLTTEYMGLKLRNPIVVSSCEITKTVTGLKKCEESGAGAVVLKSIFEEQFLTDNQVIDETFPHNSGIKSAFLSGSLLEYAPQHMTRMIEDAKKKISIPIIASINCQTSKLWIRFAKQLEGAGADALELNISFHPFELNKTGSKLEDLHISILNEIKSKINIPVSIKLVPQITSLPNLISRLGDSGCDAVVLFNWFLESDIDILTMRTLNRKGKGNFPFSLKWVALLADRVECEIASSGGVKNAEDVVKQILAGASAVQVCSLFYEKGLKEISHLVDGLESWMKKKSFNSLEDFKGELSFKRQELSTHNLGEAQAFFRNQYLKVYSK